MSKIRVLHIHTLPVESGSGIHTLITLQRLDKNRYEVEFACAPGGDLISKIEEIGIRFYPIKHFVNSINIFQDLLALRELVSLIKTRKYTIVHTHNTKAGFIGRLAAKLTGTPIIVHTIHGFAFHRYESWLRKRLFIILEHIAANFSDKLISVSTPLKEWGLGLGIGKEAQYCVIPDGIEIEKFCIDGKDIEKTRSEWGIKETDLVVGMVAKLWRGKGHLTLLAAMPLIIEQVPNVKFLIVGEGYLRSELEAIALKRGLKDYIIFTGFRRDIPLLTATFDIAVLPSLFEGLGRVILEAMALGKPVVASNVGGIPEVVDNGVNGFLVPPEDKEALAKAISKLLKDQELRQEMGEKAKRSITDKFAAERMVKEIQKVYDSF